MLKGKCPICKKRQVDNYMCKKCIPIYNKAAYKVMQEQIKRKNGNL